MPFLPEIVIVKSFILFVLGILVGVVGAGALLYTTASDVMLAEQVSPVSVEETVARIQKVAEADGWKVLAIRKLHESVKKHTGKDVRPVHLVDLCEPHHAGKILGDDDSRKVSVFMPCTISVYEKSDGKAYVGSTNAELLGMLFGGTVSEVMGGAVADSQAKFVEAATK